MTLIIEMHIIKQKGKYPLLQAPIAAFEIPLPIHAFRIYVRLMMSNCWRNVRKFKYIDMIFSYQ